MALLDSEMVQISFKSSDMAAEGVRVIVMQAIRDLVEEGAIFDQKSRTLFVKYFPGNSILCKKKALNAVPTSKNGLQDPKRKSSRVPNLTQKLESEYEFHLRNSTQDGLEKRWISPILGYGVFATKRFRDKEFVTEYKGELIDNKTALERFESYPKELGSFMFFLGKSFYNKCIDATVGQDFIGRYVNHSPRGFNTKAILKIIDNQPRVFLVAITDIEPETEILYDYNDRDPQFPFLSK